MNQFKKELTELLNRHSVENTVDMPDFILADMICDLITVVGAKVKARDKWMGKFDKPTQVMFKDMEGEEEKSFMDELNSIDEIADEVLVEAVREYDDSLWPGTNTGRTTSEL
jgi:hypothetical protein